MTDVAPVSSGGRATVNLTAPQWHRPAYIFLSSEDGSMFVCRFDRRHINLTDF
jgi:hypothetical protein